MLAERFAKLASQITVTARLLNNGEEITTPGYAPQSATFKSDGKVATAEVEFSFADAARFDAVEWSDGTDVLRVVKVAYDGPRGTHNAALEVEVDA